MAANIGSNKLGNNGGRFYDFLNRPVLIDCNFVVDNANGNGLGIRNLKGAGVQNVFMHTTASPGIGANGQLNPNPAPGYALIQLMNNYNRYAGGFSGFVSPLSGSSLAINAAALTVGKPYVIVSVGNASAGTQTITTVADVAGSLASTWFRLSDGYGNTLILWFSVSGVGSAPIGVSGSLIQVPIHTNDSAATVASQLVLVLQNILAAQPGNLQAPSGVFSVTASAVSNVVTVVNTQTKPHQFPGVAADGAIPTGFAFALTVYTTGQQAWNQVGLPVGVLPTVGASFIATKTGYSTGGGSSGLVQAPSVSGVNSIEVIGDANASLSPIPMGGSPNVGGWILVQMLSDNVVAAPANNSVCGMSFHVEAGSILIQGE